jgi:hypothetical protein
MNKCRSKAPEKVMSRQRLTYGMSCLLCAIYVKRKVMTSIDPKNSFIDTRSGDSRLQDTRVPMALFAPGRPMRAA